MTLRPITAPLARYGRSQDKGTPAGLICRGGDGRILVCYRTAVMPSFAFTYHGSLTRAWAVFTDDRRRALPILAAGLRQMPAGLAEAEKVVLTPKKRPARRKGTGAL